MAGLTRLSRAVRQIVGAAMDRAVMAEDARVRGITLDPAGPPPSDAEVDEALTRLRADGSSCSELRRRCRPFGERLLPQLARELAASLSDEDALRIMAEASVMIEIASRQDPSRAIGPKPLALVIEAVSRHAAVRRFPPGSAKYEEERALWHQELAAEAAKSRTPELQNAQPGFRLADRAVRADLFDLPTRVQLALQVPPLRRRELVARRSDVFPPAERLRLLLSLDEKTRGWAAWHLRDLTADQRIALARASTPRWRADAAARYPELGPALIPQASVGRSG